jgi:predicted hydrocarbon binding protein
MEEGILAGALKAVGCPATITQTSCFRKGADRCVFVIRSNIKDYRWSGETPG